MEANRRGQHPILRSSRDSQSHHHPCPPAWALLGFIAPDRGEMRFGGRSAWGLDVGVVVTRRLLRLNRGRCWLRKQVAASPSATCPPRHAWTASTRWPACAQQIPLPSRATAWG